MSKIYGNTESVRKSLIEYMETFVSNVYSPGEFLPPEIAQLLKMATEETGRETAVFLDRKNRVTALGFGDFKSVSLPEVGDDRRSEKRLSGVRLWHTHPNGASTPSDVDVSSLKTLRLDACGVIGVSPDGERITGISATLLKRSEETGEFDKSETHGPVSISKAYTLNVLFDEIKKIEAEASDYSGHETGEEVERAILVGVLLHGETEDNPLAELAELARSAGAVVVDKFVQKRPAPDTKYYVGKGLAEELGLRRQALNADLIIVDDELTASTVRNLEAITGARVIDRTTLILDIFALRAKSREGKLQVELAQQKYRLPRLMGMGISMSRLGGGIGTRGPGETKLQSDRNHIRRRIAALEEELRQVEQRRGTLRKERTKNRVPVAAVVGYTNAGKSTLVNKLCGSDVYVENMLFATLDTSVRKMQTEDNKEILLTDTVGFIKKLPHDLVEAFKSTLEELKYSDLLLHVVDGSSEDAESQIQVVKSLIKELGAEGKPQFLIINKADKGCVISGEGFERVFKTSAATGEGLQELRDEIIRFFTPEEIEFNILLSYAEGGKLSYIHENGQVYTEDYTEEGIRVSGKMIKERFDRL